MTRGMIIVLPKRIFRRRTPRPRTTMITFLARSGDRTASTTVVSTHHHINSPDSATAGAPYADKTILEIFFKLWPMQRFEDVMVKQTSAALEEGGDKKTCVGEMLQYLVLWLLMATCSPALFTRTTGRRRSETNATAPVPTTSTTS